MLTIVNKEQGNIDNRQFDVNNISAKRELKM